MYRIARTAGDHSEGLAQVVGKGVGPMTLARALLTSTVTW